MRKVDFLASEPHFVDHLAPVWKGLPEEYRGKFLATNTRAFNRLAQVGIYPHGEGPRNRITLVASYGDYKKTRGPVIYMEHGAGFQFGNNHPSYAGTTHRERVELFLCPNRQVFNLNKKTHPSVPASITGTPKMDTVIKRPQQGRTVAISFHWDCLVAPETRSALAHYRRMLPIMARSRDINLIGHSHPNHKWQHKMRKIYRSYGIPFEPDFANVLETADLYVVDTSSTAYEFAATGRNVVTMNAPWYRRDVDHGIRFWDYIPGPQVDNRLDLLPTIRETLNNPHAYTKQREDAVSHVYPHRGEATKKTVNRIIKHLL